MSFSAHADSKGILGLIKHCEPETVVLVHGEKGKMEVMAEVIKETFKVPCYFPANHEDLYIDVKAEEKSYPIGIDEKLLSIDFSHGLRIPLLLLREGDSSITQKTNIAKEFSVTFASQIEEIVEDDQQELQEQPGQTFRLLPHKVIRQSAADYS